MKTKQPTTAEWKRLYELAAELKQLAPWEWMEEVQIFGVENPDTGEVGFVSVMGMLGEHLSVGVYCGVEGLYGFWDYHVAGHDADPLSLFEIPQLQVSFENREQVEPQDREIMKKLGLKFRGAQNYPLFRSIRPGFLPWFITSDEARALIYAIEQTLEVAPRVRENPDLLEIEGATQNEVVLVRFAEKQGRKLVWREEMREISPPADEEVTINIPSGLVDELKAFPQAAQFVLEIGLFYLPNAIAERGKRPYFPKLLMLADARNGMILGFQLLQPQDNDAENYADISRHLFGALHNLKARPHEIRLVDQTLLALLQNTARQLNVKLRQTSDLPAVEAARDSMFGFFGSGF
jgi:hypothetical protein